MSTNFTPFCLALGLPLFTLLLLLSPLVNASEFSDIVNMCSSFNFTLTDCMSFYNLLSSTCFNPPVVNVSNITVSNCTNQTVYVNQTVTVPLNCSEDIEMKKMEFTHAEEMAKIQSGKVDGISSADCDLKISEAVVKERSNFNLASSSKSSDTNYTYWIIGAVIVLGLVYFGSKKFSKNDFSRYDQQYFDSQMDVGSNNDKKRKGELP